VRELTNPVRLDKSGIKPAARVLSRAFQNSPVFQYLLPDVLERENKLHYLFEMVIRAGLRYGEVYATSDNLEVIAVWSISAKGDNMSLWRMLRAGSYTLAFRYRRDFYRRQPVVTRFITAAHNRNAPFRHWFLEAVGVDPIYHGKGYASVLLKPMLARIDRENLPCYLDTAEEKNVMIYQHYGFQVLEEAVIPGTEITLRAMLRDESNHS
jgi:GNAT superfamily N-acetyltransferase